MDADYNQKLASELGVKLTPEGSARFALRDQLPSLDWRDYRYDSVVNVRMVELAGDHLTLYLLMRRDMEFWKNTAMQSKETSTDV